MNQSDSSVAEVSPSRAESQPHRDLVIVGRVLDGFKRGCLEDVVDAYELFRVALGQSPSSELPEEGTYGQAHQAFVALLANLDASDVGRHWRETDRLMHGLAITVAFGLRKGAEDHFDVEDTANAMRLIEAAQRYEQIARGGGR